MSFLLKIIAFGLSLLSPASAQKLGAGLGLIWFHVIRIRRKTVLENLEMALPHRRNEHLRIARDAYRHFGMTAVEFLRMSRMSKEDIAQEVEVSGMEHFDAAAARNRGVIVVTAHLGNFDLLAASQAARGIPLAVVSRNLHDSGVNQFWMKTRQKSGLQIFEHKGQARKILRHLRQGGVVALTADQRTRPERGGVLLPFMGHPAMTPTAPASLAAASGSPIVPVRIERQADGRHFAVVESAIWPDELAAPDGIVNVTNKLNGIIGDWAAECPEQYMWIHRRFVINLNYPDLSQIQ
jgi:KDO2-lipid IV(A) lauroyltransferase